MTLGWQHSLLCQESVLGGAKKLAESFGDSSCKKKMEERELKLLDSVSKSIKLENLVSQVSLLVSI